MQLCCHLTPGRRPRLRNSEGHKVLLSSGYIGAYIHTLVLLLLQPVGEQGVAAPCVSFALYASCIHVVHIRLLLYIHLLMMYCQTSKVS